MNTSFQPTVSIIVPVHNGGQSFRQCLTSLKALTPPAYEIIAVLDGCTDDSPAIASAAHAKVVCLPESRGPAQARNAGARLAQGEFLFFVDADVVVSPDALKLIMNIFQQSPGMAAVIGSYDDAPLQRNFLSHYKNLFHHYTHQTGRDDAHTFWGACGAVRRSVFMSVGGFNEHFLKPSIEDIELGYRLVKAGHKIRMLKSLQIKHLKHWDASSLLKSDILCRAIPWTELMLKDRSLLNDLNVRVSSRISVALVYLLLACLACGPVWGWRALCAAAASGSVLAAVNFPMYKFFYIKRGFCFTLKSIPWHWLYYCYCGIGLIIGVVRQAWQGHIKNQGGSFIIF